MSDPPVGRLVEPLVDSKDIAEEAHRPSLARLPVHASAGRLQRPTTVGSVEEVGARPGIRRRGDPCERLGRDDQIRSIDSVATPTTRARFLVPWT
jgi:hypothetical protein